MKHSGFIWLGAVPKHWSIGRFKHAGRFQTGMDHKHLDTGSIPVFGSSEIPFGHVNTPMSSGPAIAIGRKGTIDKPFMIHGEFWAVDTCMFNRITSPKYEIGYCFYVAAIVPWLDYSTKTALPSLTQTQVDNVPLPRPGIDEQRRIANHLDRATTRIDALVSKKSRFIELLREKRRALITHSVSKGLDIGAPMKDSGVDWLGKVPAHWDIVPPTVLFRESKERARPSDQMLSATQKYGVIPLAEFEALEKRQVTKATTNFEMRKHVELGDFVISMRSMDGGLERAHAIGSVRSSYSVLNAGPEVDGRFFGLLMKSSLYIQALRLTSNFIRDGQDLNFGHVRMVRLPKPGLKEQAEIVAYLDRATSRIDTLIAKTERSIELLREHRSALITATVTGKIDLRNVVLTQ